jgi:putative transcriptional regulator
MTSGSGLRSEARRRTMTTMALSIHNNSSLTGRLLIANPSIGDTRFDRSVILICSHCEEHAMGLVLNRPVPELRLRTLLKQLKIEEAENAADALVLQGGPVDRDRGFVLHSDDYQIEESTLEVGGGIALTATRDILKDLASGRGPQKAILALGYSGWGPGQLEEEIQHDAWLIGLPDEELVFSERTHVKWDHALGILGIHPARLSQFSGEA